ncbi:MFS transporter [Orrella sp. JC864]|uniref:MFS transporter n=1 Tax=Orrella sp. JC864 TaxID=3120298 RepID=UPI003FA73BA8
MTDASFSWKKIAIPAFGPSLLDGLSKGAILPVVALSARDLGASVAMAGVVAALIGGGSLLSNIPAAMLTARYGERKAIAGAAVVSMAGLLLAVLATQVWMLALGMLIVGVASSVFMLARQVYLVEAVPLSLRARALSTLGGMTRVGVFVGPFAGAGLIHLMGLAGAYWIAIAAMAASAWVVLRWPDLSSGKESAKDVPRPQMRKVARENVRTFMTLGVGVLLVGVLRSSRQVVVPLWAEHLGIDAATTSLIYGLVAAIDMAVFYPAGKVMDQRGRIWVAVPCTLLMGLSLIGIPFTSSMGAFVLVSLVLGFGNGIGSGIVMTLGADSAPAHQRTQFLGIWRLMSDVGTSGGPLLLSAVSALASLAAGAMVIGALGLVAAGVFWRWVPRGRRAGAAAGKPS